MDGEGKASSGRRHSNIKNTYHNSHHVFREKVHTYIPVKSRVTIKGRVTPTYTTLVID